MYLSLEIKKKKVHLDETDDLCVDIQVDSYLKTLLSISPGP